MTPQQTVAVWRFQQSFYADIVSEKCWLNFWNPTLLCFIGLHKTVLVLLVSCASYCMTEAFTNHGDKVQQVHPWLVGLGVSQREEGWQLEPHSVACVTALRTTERQMENILYFSLTTKDENQQLTISASLCSHTLLQLVPLCHRAPLVSKNH